MKEQFLKDFKSEMLEKQSVVNWIEKLWDEWWND